MKGAASGGDVWLRTVEIRGDWFPDHENYPFNIAPLQKRQQLTFTERVSFFVGENGSGKSTLIDAIARRCGLHIWVASRRRESPPGYRRAAEHLPGRLSEYVRVTLNGRVLRGGVFSAESFREWAEFLDDVSEIDPGQARYHGGAGLTRKSHGESLLTYFRGRYQFPGLYFLDEPESALSPASQVNLLRLLAEYRRRGHAQFVVATHSPILMALTGAQIFHFDRSGIEETSYEHTAHYRLYRDFMADPKSFVGE